MVICMNIRNVSYGGFSIALLAICSWISIPLGIPFTMQTFAIYLIYFLFGAKQGMLYVSAYLLAGAIGLPVFSGFHSGLCALLGLTGGYLLGFLAIGISLYFYEIVKKGKLFFAIMGLFLCYGFGTIWFVFVSQNQDVYSILSVCVIPFVIPDIFKLFLAFTFSNRLKPLLYRKESLVSK